MEVNHTDLGQSSHLEDGGDNEIRLMMPIEENIKRLYEASKIGSVQDLKVLIQEDPDIIAKALVFSSNTGSPLHISVTHGHLEFTQFLLNQKPELTIEVDMLQQTPLHLASANGDIEIVQALLEKNTSPCLVHDLNGLIPLHHAVIREQIKIMQELINARPQSVWTKLGCGQTILHLCVKHNCVEAMKFFIRLLIDDEVFFNTIDDNGNTILDLSLMLRQIEIIRYLLHVPGIKTGTNTLDLATTNVIRRCPRSSCNFKIQQTESGLRGRRPSDLQLSASPAKKQSCWKVLKKHLKYKGDWLKEVQGTLMLVASVIATMSFQGVINPPGGVWQQDTPIHNESLTFKAGTSVMAPQHKSYAFYLIVTSFSFLASVSVILLIISGFPLRNRIGAWLLKLAMCSAVAFLSLSYLLGMMMVSLPFNFINDNFTVYFAIFLWFWALGIVGFCWIIRLLILVVKILIWVLKRIVRTFNSKVPTASTTT